MGAEKDLKFMPRPYGDGCATGTGRFIDHNLFSTSNRPAFQPPGF
jgi:hypothetical protein